MNKYQSYKSSSVDWIGEIPSSWDSGKMKYVLSNNDGGVWGTDIEDEEVGTLVVRSTEITIEGNWDLSQILKRKLTESEVFKCKLYEGDIVITKSSGSPQHIGKSVLVSKEIEDLNCCYSNFVQRIRFKDYNSKLYHYILNSEIVREQFKYLTTSSTGLGNLNGTSLNDVLIPFIPLNEQIQIVQFLDEKTEFIDRLISTKERKITLLKEQRTLLINQVVTKGLNSNVKMKDSGVEWIGEIPEMWLMGKIKFLSEIISKGTTPSTVGREVLEVGNIFYVKVENIKEGYVGVPPSYFIDEETDKILSRSSLKENDILVVITGSTIGKVVILPKEFTPSNTNQGISFVRLKNKSNVRFVWYWLSTEIIQDRIKVVCTQSTQPNLSMEDLGNFSIPLPSELEQLQIVEYLDSKTKEIDDLVKLEQKKIDLLKQYRQSLISEVVTGKIKVTTDE